MRASKKKAPGALRLHGLRATRLAAGRCSCLCSPQEAGNASTPRCNACCPEVKEEASFPTEAGDEAGGHGGRQALQRSASPCLRTSAVAACAAHCMQQEVCSSTTGIAAPRSALHPWHASAQ